MNINWLPTIDQVVEEIERKTGKQIQLIKYIFHIGDGKTYNDGFNEIYNSEKTNPDLIVCHTTELGLDYNNSIQETLDFFQTKFKDNKFLLVINGIYPNPPSVVFPKSELIWFKNVINANNPIDYSDCNQRTFVFDALLGGKRDYRNTIFEYLREKDLLKRSLCFLKTDFWGSYPHIPDYESPELFNLERKEIQKYKLEWNDKSTSSNSIEIDKEGNIVNASMSCVISPEIYKNSWFSIVTESTIEESQKVNFLTEKTAKCLFSKRIFVCMALPNHLKCLRDLGFKTFDGIIDESYDQEEDKNKRLEMLCEQILWLSHQDPVKLYEKAKPILEHNFQVMTKTDLGVNDLKNFILNHLE